MRETIRLGDLCTVVSGTTPKTGNDEYWDGDILWVTPAELTEESFIINDTVRKITDKAVKESGLKSFPKGTVLLSSRAPIGKVAIAGREMYCNQGFKNFICNDELKNEYLYWFLKGKTEYLNSLGRGATFKEISKSIVENILIPLPDWDNQIHISTVLSKCQAVIKLRKEQIKQLDDLIKSRFVEMFGTLDTNEKEFDFAPLKDLCSKITDGKHGGCESVTGTGCFFVGAREIYDGLIHYDTAPEISHSDFEKDYRRCNVEKGDFLIVNTGATIGKSAIALDERTENTLLQKSVALIKTKKNILLPVFLQYCYVVNPKMYLVESSSAQPNLLLSKIKETVVYVPSVELQNQFATFVQQVDKLKVTVQKALDETQQLFDSLMQTYFC